MGLDEHAIQAAVIRWAKLQSGAYPSLRTLYAIPNGGKRHIRVALKLKREGVKAGVPDLHLPVARGGFIGLYIEMKDDDGVLSKSQKEVIPLLIAEGHLVEVCRTIESACELLRAYVRGEIKNPASSALSCLGGVLEQEK